MTGARPADGGARVLCVGNLVVGGAGKTPVCLDVGQRLAARGTAVHFLSRGYKGRLTGPVRVNPEIHTYLDVGDEPLLLARRAPAWVSRDRLAGCRAAARDGAGVVVMDDGYQNPGLAKDLSLLVVDARRGFGNGRPLPAGPLRESVADGLARADAVALLGEGGDDVVADARRFAGPDLPILRGRLVPDVGPEKWNGQAVVAFSGIGDPGKFFATLNELGCNVQAAHPFPDHHAFSRTEIEELAAEAQRRNAVLVTTEKDAARLSPEDRRRVRVLTIRVEWDDEGALVKLLDPLVVA
jgi:tetraacyldisaccharide 4'-kinase